MKMQALDTVWDNISGEAAWELKIDHSWAGSEMTKHLIGSEPWKARFFYEPANAEACAAT